MLQVAHSGTEKAQKLNIQPIKNMDDTIPMQNEGTENNTELEPHILLLHKFLGKQFAERFLDPSYEVPVSRVQPLHLDTEGCGAKDYWRLLREHSEARLMQDIATDIPGAFTNPGVSHLPPSKLLDEIRDYKRTLWLMSRVSEINQEKAILFMTKYPLPDVNEWQNTNSPPKYLSKDTFLTKKINQLEKSFHLPPLKTTNSIQTKNKHTSTVPKMVVGNNYRFLTEETLHGFKGGFSQKFTDIGFQRQMPKGPYQQQTLNQQSITHANENEPSCSTTNGSRSPAWEPLTYTALTDSKSSITVPGRGQFRHGQQPQWPVNSSTIN
ncbi:testis-specific gene 13 protein-like isoform X2 [Rana temporaria]|uniref:testis-specific gene 13 protein-like isoform X2 n=1 Tax=Rana temporaria TaxID=8407 RepID=UPI001AAE1366|nr:testis-specific gene 13 protein-like isoform X2 [Rana temporaria]